MATRSPRLSDSETNALPSRAEAKVYRWLRELDYPGLQDMQGLATQARNDKGIWASEVDFLLFHPQHRIQVWEVKGGGIRLDGEGQWWSEGNRGTFKLSTAPLDQIKKQTNSLLQTMQKGVTGTRLPIAPVLVFTDPSSWEGQLPELALNSDHLLLKGELEELNAEVIKLRFGNVAWAGPRSDNSLPLDKQQANLIQHNLRRPACALMSSVAEQYPLLQEVEPQHALQASGRTTSLAGCIGEVERRQRLDQPLPRHQGIHPGQEPFVAGDLSLLRILGLGTCSRFLHDDRLRL